ncbi:MAG TPA: peptide ABC transporter substrate-binding protein, partial [Geminicoccaceae bacterium]|nr:peptide ABC transporter substrate-binding protein [Geminicoccaceae bacterium]
MTRTLLAGLCLSLAAALLPAAPAKAQREQLTIGISQFPSTLHPLIDAMLAKSYVLGMTLRPLTMYDHDWRVVCMLCTELPTLENGLAKIEELEGGGKGMAITFTLHPEATWGDGTPVTADDVVFTWEVGRHPQSGVTSQEGYRRILSIDVRDARTFTFHVDRVTFDYNSFGDLDLLPAHLEREVFEADPAAYRSRTLFDTDPANPGLAYGPYRITEVASGSHVVLEPNPTWYGRAPAFGRIVVRVIENTAALEANLLSGGIDMIAGELGLTIDQALAFEKRHGRDYRVIYHPGLIYEHIDLNLDHPILADRRVRKALIMGLDREALNQRLFEG